MTRKIVIVGGGIAGLTTAYTLLKQRGDGEPPFEVTILEAEDVPGGQARAFKVQPTARGGGALPDEKPFTVEHGSHVFFNFYDTIMKLIEELRAGDGGAAMPAFNRVAGWTIVDAYGASATLKQGSTLPVPYSVFPSILEIPWLPLLDRAHVGYGALAIVNRTYEEFGELDQMTSQELALASGYTEAGVQAWNSASLGLTNLFIQEQSGALFCAKHKVLIDYPDGLSYRLPAGDLGDLFANPMKKKLDALGVTFVFNATVSRVSRPEGAPRTEVRYVISAGTEEASIEADHVILAIAPSAAAALVPWIHEPWTQLQKVTPVVTVVMRLSAELTTSPDGREFGMNREQWAFSVVTDLSKYWPEYEGLGKTVLRCEIGHADRLPNWPNTGDEELIGMIQLDLARLYPEVSARNVVIEAYAIHRETERLYTKWVKGEWSKKPKDRDVGQGIYLAGDWTTKGTIGMEAAANSGIEAANTILIAAGLPPVPFRNTPL
jgi:protoporphyrinogen oxidase